MVSGSHPSRNRKHYSVAKTERSKSSNQLIRFRLAVATEILGNHSNTLGAKTDIRRDIHIFELLDEYAIRILIEWLCTKLGCKIYAKDAQSGNKAVDLSIAGILQDLLAYPFLNTRQELISNGLRHRCDQLLTDCFEPTFELAGALYEHICNRPLEFVENRQIGVSADIQESDSRRPVGQFYTPPNIVRYCFDLLQEADLNNFISQTQSLPKTAQKAALTPSNEFSHAGWKMLDPACGTGNFLIGAVRFASTHIANKYALREFCKSALFGIELDGKAASIARICVALQTISHSSNSTVDATTIEAETVRAETVPAETVAAEAVAAETVAADAVAAQAVAAEAVAAETMSADAVAAEAETVEANSLIDMMIVLQRNIVVSDSVMQTMVSSSDSKDCASHFHQSRNWLSGRTAVENFFDLVITNPPYVSFGSRGQPDLLESQRTLLKGSFPEGAEYKIRLHSIFQDIVLRLCRPGGMVILFVPDAFLTGSYYGRLRKLILTQARITSLSELPESTVPGAVVGRWCVAQYEKKSKRTYESAVQDVVESKDETSINSNATINANCSTDSELDYSVQLHTFCEEPPIEYSARMSSLLYSDRSKIRLLFNDLDEKIFVAISAHSPLCIRVLGHTGIRSRHGQSKIISTEFSGPLFRRGLKSGAQVTPFKVVWDGTWINVDPHLLFAGGFDREVIERPKVLLRQTGDRLIAAVDESGLYHLNNLHSFSASKLRKDQNCTSKNTRNNFGKQQSRHHAEDQSAGLAVSEGSETSNPYYVCALMNSSLWLYIYQMTTRERSRALAQIDIETVESLPVPTFNPRLEEAITGLSLQLHKNYSAEVSRGIDRLVYDIYGLEEYFVDHIESYYTKVQGFKGTRILELPTADEAVRMSVHELPVVQTVETRYQ